MAEALDDVRVLDLSEGIAGPFCTKLLAALGADVISVEAPGRGDRARSYAPFPDDEPHPELSGLFLYLNTGKRSVTLDLEQASGRALCRPLADWADIVIEDFAPGRLDAWGLGYGALDAARDSSRPGVIVVSVTGLRAERALPRLAGDGPDGARPRRLRSTSPGTGTASH